MDKRNYIKTLLEKIKCGEIDKEQLIIQIDNDCGTAFTLHGENEDGFIMNLCEPEYLLFECLEILGFVNVESV